jgi:ComF family protein
VAIDGIRSVFRLEGGVREAIHQFKYKNRHALTLILARLMADYWHAHPLLPVDFLMPVPLHPARQRERGYNQSELLARALSSMIGVPLVTTGLRRVRHTRPQMSLNAADRRPNVRGAFVYQSPGGSPIRGRRIVVIDDVCTTGSTLEACSVALKEAGASTVWGFTLARA